MEKELKIKMYSFTLDCINPYALAKFYAELLNWEILLWWELGLYRSTWNVPGAYPGILFQRNPEYCPPVWPEEPGVQQQMAHLDFAVNDLEEAVQHAINCGATMAAEQFSKEWRRCLILLGILLSVPYESNFWKRKICFAIELKDTSEKFFLYIWISVLIYGSCGKVKIALFQMLQLQIRE